MRKLTISLEKVKIASRHFNSLLLSLFYTSEFEETNQTLFNSFENMGIFLGLDAIPAYETILSRQEYELYRDLSIAFEKEMKSYIDDWNLASSTTQRNAIRYNMKQKYQQSLIEAFAVDTFYPIFHQA